MKSIGGDFDISPAPVKGVSATRPTCPATGRGALYQILTYAVGERDSSVAVPNYICGSVVQAIEAAGMVPSFYRIDDDLRPNRTDLLSVLERGPAAVVVVSYFGLVDPTDAIRMVREAAPKAVIIKDDVQAPFDVENLRGAHYAFTSLRKAFPVVDGAPTNPVIPSQLAGESPFVFAKLAGAVTKYLGRLEPLDDERFLELFAAGEDLLDSATIYDARMSSISAGLMETVDRPSVAWQRRENFRALEEAIEPLGLRSIVSLPQDRVPLFLPVRVRDRDRVRHSLARRQIYCPVHWPIPDGHDAAASSSRAIFDEELSLVIDQRYDANDMRRLAEALQASLKYPATDAS